MDAINLVQHLRQHYVGLPFNDKTESQVNTEVTACGRKLRSCTETNPNPGHLGPHYVLMHVDHGTIINFNIGD